MAATSRGIDVSSFQGPRDWAADVRGGLTFAFAKASEGERGRDAHFDMHITGIIGAGLVPGAYHFGWPNQNAATEAANYVAAVKAHARRGFVHILDLERRTDGGNYAGASNAAVRAYAEAWIAAVREEFPGQRVGVYTSADDIAAGRMPTTADFLWYPAYPAGALSYTQAEQRGRPSPSGRKPLFWQFTSTPLDRDLAYLTPAALREWAGLTTITEDTMPDVKDLWGYKGAKDGKPDPHDAYAYLRGTNADVQTINKRLAALTATVDTLAKALGSAKGVDTKALITAVTAAIDKAVPEAVADAAIDVDVTVHDATPAAPTKG